MTNILTDRSEKAQLSSLKRGLSALVLMNKHHSITVSQLSAHISVPRTTARRILDTLAAEGFAEKIPFENSYHITPDVRTLSEGISDDIIISHVSSPILLKRTKEIRWPLAIATIDGEQVLLLLGTDRASPFAITHYRSGYRLPITGSTSGQVALAFMSEEQRERLIAKMYNPKMYRRNVFITGGHDIREKLRTKIVRVKERGFALDEHPWLRQSSLCVPVLADGTLKCCLYMQYITSAISREDVVGQYFPILKGVAAKIGESFEKQKSRVSGAIGKFSANAADFTLL